MMNRLKSSMLRDKAKELIYSNDEIMHAIYGICYVTSGGNLVEQLADTEKEIRLFKSNDDFNDCVDKIHLAYSNCEYVNIYSVHRAM